MGPYLSKEELEKRFQERVQVIPGSDATEKITYKFSDIEEKLAKIGQNAKVSKALSWYLEKMKEALETNKSVALAARVPLGAAAGPCGVIALMMVEQIEKSDEVPERERVEQIATEVCNKIVAESCSHGNQAVMLSVMKDLETFTEFGEERKERLKSAHTQLEINADTLARHIQDYTDRGHFNLFQKWCASAKLHITVAEELARYPAKPGQDPEKWQKRRDGIIRDYKAKFNYLAEGFMRQRVFAIVGSYWDGRADSQCYDCVGDGAGTQLTKPAERFDLVYNYKKRGLPEAVMAYECCRQWMRSRLLDLLLPQAEDFNRDLNKFECVKMLLSFVPDSEIKAFYGPFNNPVRGHRGGPKVHLGDSPF